MLELQDNLFNSRRSRDQSKLKLWRYAGLMLTYRCSAACRFCYYYCSPQAGGLMSVDRAIQSWEGLVRLAGENAKVHITGGEPFLYFDRLAQICKQASQMGLTPPDSIETNAGSWNSPGELTDQLRFLDDCGLDHLKVSWDAFHEEFIEIDKVRQFIHIARETLGPDRVLVRWEKHLTQPTRIQELGAEGKKRILLAALDMDSCRFTGRAAESLAPLVAHRPAEDFRGQNCQNSLLGSKGVHIDPDGNVFNGQCSGMIVGNVNQAPLNVLWRTFEPDRAAFWKVLYEKGPFGLLEQAQGDGFRPRDKYALKCHLCCDIRRFFFDKRTYSTIIGPHDCYGKHNSQDGGCLCPVVE
ncbi:MAG: radical SAM protein [Planctomycetota bacterium]|jgi:MoaA/NifB/PqqE/SkfB family radical SAM enzyme